MFFIVFERFWDRAAKAKKCGNDCAGASSVNRIEKLSQRFARGCFKFPQKSKCVKSFRSAAIERQNFELNFIGWHILILHTAAIGVG